MASTASGLLKTFENRTPAPLVRRFGAPAATAWTGIVVLIAAFGIINYSAGMLLNAMMHPAAEAVAAPASVTVDLPPPLTPRVAPAVAAVMPAGTTQRSTRWRDQSASRRYRHGWGHRRWRERASEPAEAAPVVAPGMSKPAAVEESAKPVSGPSAETAATP
jgi:hypothetical protein